MGLFKKTTTDRDDRPRTQEAVAARASRLPDHDLRQWFENYLMLTHQAFDAHAFHDGPLEEVGLCLDSLNAMYAEMRHRERMR